MIYTLHVVEHYEIEVKSEEIPIGVDVDEWLSESYHAGDFDEHAKFVSGYLDDITEENEDFKDYEYYSIEDHPDGKYMHIFGYVWKNDGREGETDEHGYTPTLPYTVTEYTGVLIPIKDLVACEGDSEKWDLIMDYEGACSQYEGDYTWNDLIEEGYGSPEMPNGVISTGEPFSARQHLHYDEITLDTPAGDYWYEV